MQGDDFGAVKGSRRARGMQLIGLGSRLGRANAAHRAKRLFASVERREQLDTEHELRSAEQVAEALGGMKGLVMKLGQVQSYLSDDLPEAWASALAALQQDAPPMSGELAATVVAESLGAAPEELFAAWDPVPFAAASIGQVHRAITHDDRAVAVKVQYPGIADALAADLDNAELLMRLTVRSKDTEADAPPVDLQPLVEEFRQRLSEEVDYRLEARNQQQFSSYFAEHPFIDVPRVVEELCADRVLTTELVDGERFGAALTWTQDERDLAGEAVFRFVFHAIFRIGAYNGDPHPGNYLFRPGGHVTFLDFGLVKKVDAGTTALLGRLFERGLVAHDRTGFRLALEELGLLRPGAVSDDTAYELMARPWEGVLSSMPAPMPFPSMDSRPGTQTPQQQELAEGLLVPRDFLILLRTIGGMQAILSRLGARAAWRRIAEEIWPFVEAAPSTKLGVEEAAWRAVLRRQ